MIYGSYEYRLGLPPIIASPLSNLYIDKYAPLSGYVSRLDDISEYKAPVVSPDQAKVLMHEYMCVANNVLLSLSFSSVSLSMTYTLCL